MKLALLTPAIGSRNAGDAMIESAIRRLVPAESFERFTLRRALTGEEIAALNACDAAIICGSNLYQNKLQCALDADFLNRLRVPLIPLGIGASSATGTLPQMSAGDADIVRGLHSRSALGSVRDGPTLRFLQSLGIQNVRLTGCPVLFHGLSRPEIQMGDGVVTLSLRQTFLHGAEPLEAGQEPLLDAFCNAHRPTLITQGPADLDQAKRLVWRHGLDHIYDDENQCETHEWLAPRQAWTGGFRLHYGMLSLSHGRPAWFIGHDTRVQGFCELMGLPYLDIREASPADVLAWGPQRMGDFAQFGARWQELAAEMRAVLVANGLPCALDNPPKPKPRLLFMVPRREWAYDFSALSMRAGLENEYDVRMRYSTDAPILRPESYDLAIIFYWAEIMQLQRGFDPNRVIQYVSSHRWQFPGKHGPLSVHDFIWKYLSRAGTIFTTSMRLLSLLHGEMPRVFHAPNGFEPAKFRRTRERRGPLRIGAAGWSGDSVKGFGEILVPAAAGYDFELADGQMSHAEMNNFYNQFDVVAITSAHEGEPLTLIEAMAAGCFPVCSDVGIVPELIRDRENGIIVKQRTIEGFREAFAWCAANLDKVREGGRLNAIQLLETRSWEHLLPDLRQQVAEAMAWGSRPRFIMETASHTDAATVKKLQCLLGRFRQSVALEPPDDEPMLDLARDVQRHAEAGKSWRMLPGYCYKVQIFNVTGPQGLGWEGLEKALSEALLPAPPVRFPLVQRTRRFLLRQLQSFGR